jgi:hypothetical protein
VFVIALEVSIVVAETPDIDFVVAEISSIDFVVVGISAVLWNVCDRGVGNVDNEGAAAIGKW